jgi:hypothetical protein
VKEIKTMADLTKRIKELEMIESQQIVTLKMQRKDLSNSLRPVNLLKSAFSGVVSSKSIQHKALDASVGLGAGWLIKKILTPKSKSIVGNITGKALQVIATTLISKKLPSLRRKIAES